MWKSAPPTPSSTSSSFSTCPRKTACETPVWSSCCWTPTERPARLSSAGSSWAPLPPALPASTGARSVTTRADRSLSGTRCPKTSSVGCIADRCPGTVIGNSWLSGQDLNCGLVAGNVLCQSTDLSHIIGVGLLLKGEAAAEPGQLMIPKTVSDARCRFFFMLHSKPDRSPLVQYRMSCCYCCSSLLTVNNNPLCDKIKENPGNVMMM